GEGEVGEVPRVASVEDVVVADVEGAGDDAPAAPRDHEAEPRLPADPQQIEERSVQVLAAPVELVDRRMVEPEHEREERVGDLVAGDHLDLDPLFYDLPALAPYLRATLALESREIVIEVQPTRILPVVLIARAVLEADRGERLDLVGQTEVHVNRREGVLTADLLQPFSERPNHAAALRCSAAEKPGAARRREWHRHEQLWIICDATTLGRLRPAVVE